MRNFPLHLFLFLIFFASGLSAAGAESLVPDENIHIKADSMSQGPAPGQVTAAGNVVVTWQGLNLTADQATYDSTSHIMLASGNVQVSKGKDVVRGQSLTLNLEDGRAEMDKATLTMPEINLSFSGEKITRLNESEFQVTSTELTTCDLPDPSWKFGADALKVNVLGYATGRNIVFYIKNVPVLYLPWIAFPVVREKKSGLLFPQVGYSKTRGAQLDIPVYWVISPSQDLLFDLDLLSKRGVGTGLDYRYIRRRGSEGHLGGYQIYDIHTDRWRWQLTQKHTEIFSETANLRMDVNLDSDRSFHADFGEKSGEYNRQSSETVVNALKAWQHYALAAHLRYSDDLYAADNRSTVQTLPALELAGVRQPVFKTPLYFDIDAGIANLYRENAPSGQRLQLFPRVSYQSSPGGSIQASVWAGALVRGYNTGRRAAGDGTRNSDGDLLPDVGARFSSSLQRGYDLDGKVLKKIRHEIVPEISYRYLPERSQERLPFYDYSDRMIWQNMLGFSVTSLINGKFVNGETSEYRDISRLKLSLFHSFEGGRRDLLTLVDEQRPWSDLILESDTWLNRNIRLIFDARYDLYGHRFSTAAVGLEMDDRQGNTAEVGYRMARNQLEYLEGHLATRYLKPFHLAYTVRYSFDRDDFLESVYSAEYRQKCWSVTTALRQRPGDNFSFSVNFNLAGLGGK